jgi:acyl-coenzyme A synthetase/AMP-(fatty) acid ligase
MNDWFEYIQSNIGLQPEAPALVTEDRVVTYGMLGAGIEACAKRLAAQGFSPETAVGLSIRDPIRHLTLALALFRIGQLAIAVDPAHHGIAGLKFAAMLGDAAAKQAFGRDVRFIDVTDDWFAPSAGGPARLPDPFSRPDQVCRLSLTSGTTGEPKIIGNTVEYIGRHVFPGIGVFNCRAVLSMPGLTSIFGFMVACAVLASRKTLCLAISPYQAVRMIELFSIDFLLTTPDQLVAIVRAVRKMGAHVRSLQTVATGGSIPTRALLESAAVHLCKDIRCRYGTSEVGLICEAPARDVLADPGFVGRTMPGFEVAAFTPSGAMCRAGEVGIVKARAKRPADSEPDPWTDHGDRGWLTADGRVYIVGRTSERVDPDAQAAADISPVHEIEHLLRLEWDAADAAAVVMGSPAPGEDPGVWIGTVDCKDARTDQLEAILRGHGIRARVRLVPIAAVPRGANGKVQRGILKEIFSARGSETGNA